MISWESQACKDRLYIETEPCFLLQVCPIAMEFAKYRKSSTTGTLAQFQSGTIIRIPNIVAFRLHEILRWDFLLNIETTVSCQETHM